MSAVFRANTQSALENLIHFRGRLLLGVKADHACGTPAAGNPNVRIARDHCINDLTQQHRAGTSSLPKRWVVKRAFKMRLIQHARMSETTKE